MSFQYGAPTEVPKPRCYSDANWYNINSKECRGCSVQASCRDNIIRARAVASQQPAYQYGYPTHPAQQVPVHVGPPMQQAPIQQPLAVKQTPVQQGIYPAPDRYEYGWLNDPLYYTVSASPPPMIPQLENESFMERFAKNILIDCIRSITLQAHLAARQLVLPKRLPPETVQDITNAAPPQFPPHQ